MNKEEQRKLSYCSKGRRLSVCLACLALFIFSGTALASGQNFRNKSVMTLKKALAFIEEQTGCTIAYSSKLDMNKKVEIDTNNANASGELNAILSSLGFTSRKEGNHIIIVSATATSQQKEQPKSSPEQAKRKVIGTILDVNNEPIIGASVLIKGTGVGTTTNVDGQFTLNAPAKATLVVSFIGYQSREIKVDGSSVNLTLYEDAKLIDEVVVTAFGTGQKKASMVGSVQQIKPAELKVPSSSLSSSFAGRLSGVIAVQRSGEPGADGANFWIRGTSTFSGATGALVVIDGVEASNEQLNTLDPEVIESFSVLKDATATALYGTRGANGVMIVNTKSGADLSKPIINFRLEGALAQLSQVPTMVDGITYMNMYNESVRRPGATESPYSEDKINGTMESRNPYIYPNIDWYNEMFKKNSFSERFNFNIRGGNKKMDYFMSASVKHSDGNLKEMSRKYFSYNNNISLNNYDFINNLNIQATNTTKISLGLNAQIKDWSGPAKAVKDVFGSALASNPVSFPISFPAVSADDTYVRWGGKSGSAYNSYINPVAEYVTGYSSEFNTTMTVNLKLNQKLDMLIKGLSFDALLSYKNYSYSRVNKTSAKNMYEIATYDPDTYEYDLRILGTETSTELKPESISKSDRRLYVQAMLNYSRVFFEKHSVDAMFLYNQDQVDISQKDLGLLAVLPKRRQGLAGRLSYAYDNRYLFEANFGYNGSENFPKGHKFGFFPSFAVGYNMSEEKYWEALREYIPQFKIRASWGLVGNDQTGAGRFAFYEDINLGGADYTTGTGSGTITAGGPVWNRYYNEDLTWEVGEKWNAGIDMQLFSKFSLSADIFKETRRNIFMPRNTISGIVGIGNTKVEGNFGKMQNWGFDAGIDYNNQVTKDLFVSFKGTFTFAQNKILERDEPLYRQYPNLSTIGLPANSFIVYLANGLLDQSVIDAGYKSGIVGKYPVAPGDIYYQDIPDKDGNVDGVIDANDRIPMGYPTVPEIIYGFGPSIKFKKFDLSLFFQGAARVSLMMSGFHPFTNSTENRGLLKFIADDCWTTDNPNLQAAYPRLSPYENTYNQQASSFWLRDASFLKLKNAEIGYTHKKMRFYLSGSNLLTFSKFKLWDPEMGGGSGMAYPTQTTFNVGFQMTIN